MEFPDVGKHCSEETCRKLDFLPTVCDACKNIFCSDHMSYSSHNCSLFHTKDVQVPVCPLCNAPVPMAKGMQPDLAVGEHIDNDCKTKRSHISIKCSFKGCKGKEFVPVVCRDCGRNFCFRHRHAADHECALVVKLKPSFLNQIINVCSRQHLSAINGNMNEDEALARALQSSMTTHPEIPSPADNRRNNPNNCTLS